MSRRTVRGGDAAALCEQSGGNIRGTIELRPTTRP